MSTLCNPMDCNTSDFLVFTISPRACSNSCPLSQWCHPTISSSVVPFSSCPHSFPVSGTLPISQLFTSGGQIIGASASASVLPMNLFSHSVMSDSLLPHGLQHTRLSCLSPFPRAFSNSCPSCHPLLLLPSIFPRIRVFSDESALHIRWSKYWSFSSASVLPVNIQDWFPLVISFANIFSWSVSHLFIFLSVSFGVQKTFNLFRSHCSCCCFAFVSFAWGDRSK